MTPVERVSGGHSTGRAYVRISKERIGEWGGGEWGGGRQDGTKTDGGELCRLEETNDRLVWVGWSEFFFFLARDWNR